MDNIMCDLIKVYRKNIVLSPYTMTWGHSWKLKDMKTQGTWNKARQTVYLKHKTHYCKM